MKKNQADINWLTQPTGDPFADTGGFVIKYLYRQDHLKNKSILELIEYVTKIYVKNWGGKVHSFFLNSTITQPAFKGEKKITETLRYFKSLIDETAEGNEGYCRISGRKTKLFFAGRDNHILSGSGTFINFHHDFDAGLSLSKEILIRMFFVPFGSMQLSDKIALLHSNNEKISEFFVAQNCRLNLNALAGGLSEGVLKSNHNNPANALFSFVDECSSELQIIYEDESDIYNKDGITINLYHFTNFGANPEVVISTLSASIFKFYSISNNNPKFKKQWINFIRSHYKNSKFKGAVFNEETQIWESKKESTQYESYKTWRNVILDKLLRNESILSYIMRWNILHPFPFAIVKIYQTFIRDMDKRTVEKIKQLADFIVSNKDADYIKKSIARLNKEKSAHGLRQFLLKLIEQNYRQEAKEPLIKLTDYTEYLFPDGSNWREIRDVLLIAIYENLHAAQITVEVEVVEENEPITENE